MPLKAGASLGSYEILALIGVGGMGEVYRARDTRLGRDVAVKILPEAFARDAERMRRFEQEARAVATLNHPNVLSIFDTGVQEGVPYLVSELLEGESLRQRLEEGPIPARKAVEYAQQVADGLAAAHEKNIVHRDLKPENLFLTRGGRVKILDFGLAKVQPLEAAGADGATATIAAVTNPGVVMGTAGYMAPEQVRGEPVDHRADIFSFGATLYEMLTGNRAFQRPTSVETLNAILKEDPPGLETETLHVAPGLERIVHHCLEKKPGDRFQSARDLTFALTALSDSAVASKSSKFPVAAPPRRKWLLAAGLLLGIVLAAGIAYLALRPSTKAERADFAIPVPGEVSHLAISSDGKWLAFVSPGETGAPMVYVQRIGSTEARAMPGTEGASYPFWSPDDVYIAFFAGAKLKKVALSGGEPQSIVGLGYGPRGGSWSNKGVIIYARAAGGGLWRVNPDGSGAVPLTDKLLTPSEATHRFPCFLPDGDHFLMFAGNFGDDNTALTDGLYLSSLSKLEKIELSPAHSSAGYADGRMYYVDANGALVAAPLDVRAGKLTAGPQVIASQTALSPSTYYGTFAVSVNSTVVYSAASTTNHSQLTWFDDSGKQIGVVGPVGVLANPALSPDGERVAFDSNDFKAKNIDIWILDLAHGGSSRFTFDPREEVTPVWSRNGDTIAYRSINPTRIHLKKANGLEPDRSLARLSNEADDVVPNSWSPSDQEVLVALQRAKGASQLMLVPADGSNPRPFLSGPGGVTNGQLSRDGKWVAYASDESGEWEIYVTTFPGASGKWQVSQGGGSEPRWRGDGKAIYYIGPKQMLTEVAVTAEGTFSTGTPRPLFQIHPRAPISSTDLFTYDVTADGKRFLVNQYVKPEEPLPLNIILHATGDEPK
jgi:eukaryotic-like serine/threonine-protein kinase